MNRKCRHGVVGLHLGALLSAFCPFADLCQPPGPALPGEAQSLERRERAELKRRGTGGQEAARVEGGEAGGPAGLVPRRQQRQSGDGAPAGPGAV